VRSLIASADVERSGSVAPLPAVPFTSVAHLVTLPVTLNGVETTFVLDSGIGLTVVRDPAACTFTGATFTGRRMSGQEVTLPLGVVPSLGFAGEERREVEVGLLDMSGFPLELDHVAGFLSLAYFADAPLTVDYGRRLVSVGARVEGSAVPLRVERDGPSVCVYTALTLPDERSIEVEVDMGSDSLILDERFAELGTGEVRRVDGTDETGNRYTRRFTTLRGRIHPTGAPQLGQDDPAVMFQRIIYDGLVGHAFLRRFAVTFDVPGASLLLAPAG
jgi:hypothetical protein